MTPEFYQEIRAAIIAKGYRDEIEWAQNVKAPETPEDFAGEAIWVILCSGMKEQIARKIQDKVFPALHAGSPVADVFGHKGKAAAIEMIWRDRESLFRTLNITQDKVGFCLGIPWIGEITKWHLAKNLGVDCAKPDIHLSRLAKHYRIAAASGDRIATVDVVIWRACNLGIIKTRELDCAYGPPPTI